MWVCSAKGTEPSVNRDFFWEHQGEVTLACTQKTGETARIWGRMPLLQKNTSSLLPWPQLPFHVKTIFLSKNQCISTKAFCFHNNNKAVTRSQSLLSSIARWFCHFHGICFHVTRKYPPRWLVSNKVTWTPVRRTGSSCSSANTSAIEGHPGLGAVELGIFSTLQGCSSPSMAQLKAILGLQESHVLKGFHIYLDA